MSGDSVVITASASSEESALRLGLSRLPTDLFDISDYQQAIRFLMRTASPRILVIDARREAGITAAGWERIMKSRDTSIEELTWLVTRINLDLQRVATKARIYRSQREARFTIGSSLTTRS